MVLLKHSLRLCINFFPRTIDEHFYGFIKQVWWGSGNDFNMTFSSNVSVYSMSSFFITLNASSIFIDSMREYIARCRGWCQFDVCTSYLQLIKPWLYRTQTSHSPSRPITLIIAILNRCWTQRTASCLFPRFSSKLSRMITSRRSRGRR